MINNNAHTKKEKKRKTNKKNTHKQNNKHEKIRETDKT